jgi:hypothetical protein
MYRWLTLSAPYHSFDEKKKLQLSGFKPSFFIHSVLFISLLTNVFRNHHDIYNCCALSIHRFPATSRAFRSTHTPSAIYIYIYVLYYIIIHYSRRRCRFQSSTAILLLLIIYSCIVLILYLNGTNNAVESWVFDRRSDWRGSDLSVRFCRINTRNTPSLLVLRYSPHSATCDLSIIIIILFAILLKSRTNGRCCNGSARG